MNDEPQAVPARAPILRGALANVWRAGADLLWFQLVFAAASVMLLGPLVAWLFNRLALAGGTAALGNLDIVWFLLTPTGALLGLAVASVALALTMLDVAGLLTICYAAARSHRVSYVDALRFVLFQAGRTLAASAGVILLLVAAVLPFALAAVAVAQWQLGEFDINFYLDARPPEFWSAVRWGILLLVLASGAALLVAVPMVFVLPEVLFGGTGVVAAFRNSYHLASGNRLRILVGLLGWIIAWELAAAALNVLLLMVGGLLVAQFSSRIELLVAALGGLTATSTIAGFALTLLAVSVGCAWLANLYLAVTGTSPALPKLISDAPDLSARPQWKIGRRGPLIAALAAVVIAVFVVRQVLVSTQFEDRVLILAHRGAELVAPENTLAAARRAIADGTDGIEIDVQRTADGEIVVVHDADLKRIAGSPLVVQHATAAELRPLRVEGEPIATLDEMIELAKHADRNVSLLVELKSYSAPRQPLVEGVVERLRDGALLDRSLVMSFNYDELQKVKQLEPSLPVGFLARVRIGDLSGLDVDFLAVSSSLASHALVAAAHARGMQVFVWTVNDRAEMVRLIDRGVDGIITKDPALLRSVLDERKSLSPAERLLLRFKALYAS